MNVVSLESVLSSLESGARPKGGVSADSGEIPSLGGEHVNSDGGFDFTSIKRIPRSFFEAMRGGRITRSDILVVKDGATTGKTSFVRDDFPFSDAAVNEHVFCLRVDSSKASPTYVYHFLRSERGQKAIQLDFRGATVGGISRGFAAKIRLPLPPLAEQRRIAEVLDRAEALRAKRRAALAQLDFLTQSLFLDLFGDPATNPKGWSHNKLLKLGKVVTGGTPPSAKSGMFEGPIPFVTPGDLESDEHVKRSVTEEGAQESRTVRAGSTFVCCIGATIGKMGIARVRSAFNQQINAIEWFEAVDDIYGFIAMSFFKPTVKAWGASTTLPILKKSSFEKIEIPVPPLSIQREFARRFRCAERLRSRHRDSLAKLDELFAGLQQRAFNGELGV